MKIRLKSLIMAMILTLIPGLHVQAKPSIISQAAGLAIISQDTTQVYDIADQMPQFPNGVGALTKYISSSMIYPEVAKENGIQGKVIVGFTVNTDGSLSDVHVTRNVDPSLDREAVRIVESMPRWIPGKQNGEVVKVRYNVSVVFRL